jgi:Tol biopolymer transport system component
MRLSTRAKISLSLTAVASPLMLAPSVAGASSTTTMRVSVSSSGAQANGGSKHAVLSADGRFVAFNSRATNLARHRDTNGVRDGFVRDLQTGKTVRASVDSHGRQANGPSTVVAISAGGRYVLFDSDATNLVAGDTNGETDVFVRDLRLGVTRRVDVNSEGNQFANGFGEDITPNGRYVLFGEWFPGSDARLYLRDRRTGTTRAVPHADTGADGVFLGAAVSKGAHFITYSSSYIGAPNGTAHRYNRLNGHTKRVDVGIGFHASAGVNDTTPDGRFILMTAMKDLEIGGICLVRDVWVRDMKAKRSIRVTGPTTACPPEPNTHGWNISSDGRYVTFSSSLPDFVTPDTNHATDVFRRDLRTGTTICISLSAESTQLSTLSEGGSMSADGPSVLFATRSPAVPGDTNTRFDVFIRGPIPGS